MPKKKSEIANFESSIEELEALVEQLESGDLGLQDALHLFEKGMKLSKSCETALKEAEQRIARLDPDTGQLEPMETADD